MSRKTLAVKILIPILIIAVSAFVMIALFKSRSEPRKEERNHPGVLVDVMIALRTDIPAMVQASGTAAASEEVSVIPQVSGRVVTIAPILKAGGFFSNGDLLFAIEDTDYRLALERAQAVKAKAEYELATIESQAELARKEWEIISRNSQDPPNPLVLYEPQLRSARAAHSSALASVEQARLDLSRTEIRAPFNGRVKSEDIAPGQYVRAGTSVAVLAATDTAEIIVPLPLDDLQWITLPRSGKDQPGSPADIRLSIGGASYQWTGHIIRTTGEVEARSRMIQIVVEVRDPYGLSGRKDDGRPPLASGSFVDVTLKGIILKAVYTLPRSALRDNDTVWIMDKDSRLQIRKIVPLRREKDDILIREGLLDGDRIVLTNISGAADGLILKTMNNDQLSMIN